MSQIKQKWWDYDKTFFSHFWSPFLFDASMDRALKPLLSSQASSSGLSRHVEGWKLENDEKKTS